MMFTGIVEEIGEIEGITVVADGARVTVTGPTAASDARIGDSIAVDGICLTVVERDRTSFTAELMAETLVRTTAGRWRAGTPVNLERSLTPTTRLGGHLVQGHIDGTGVLVSRTAHDTYDEVAIRVPRALGRFIAPKGAVAVDGISLTVIDVADQPPGAVATPHDDGPGGTARYDDGPVTTFTLGIIPTTRTATTLGRRRLGDEVNIEVDVMAKYAQRLLALREEDER